MSRTRLAAATAACLLSLAVEAAPETYVLDPTHTYPNFTVSHLGFSTMHGQFAKTSGTLTLDRAAGSLKTSIEIDAASIYTGLAKRDDHLRSPDFFNVAEFPKLTFESSKSTWQGERPVSVTGELSLLGVKREVTLDITAFHCAEDPWKNYRCGADAVASIKRSEFGMSYGLPNIGDEIELRFEIEGIRQ